MSRSSPSTRKGRGWPGSSTRRTRQATASRPRHGQRRHPVARVGRQGRVLAAVVDRGGRGTNGAEGHRGQGLRGQAATASSPSRRFGAGGPKKTVFNPADCVRLPAGHDRQPQPRPPPGRRDSMLCFRHPEGEEEGQARRRQGRRQGRRPRQPSPTTAGRPRQPGPTTRRPTRRSTWWCGTGRTSACSRSSRCRRRRTRTSATSRVSAGEKKFIRLADEHLPDVAPAPEQKFAIGRDDDDYELMGNLDGRRFQDIYVIDWPPASARSPSRSPAGRWGLAQAARTSSTTTTATTYTYDMATGQATNITKAVPTSFIDTEDDHPVVKPPTPPLAGRRTASSCCSPTTGTSGRCRSDGGAAINLTVDGRKDQVRYRGVVDLDPGRARLRSDEAGVRQRLRRVDEEGRHRRHRAGQAGREAADVGGRGIRPAA